MSKYRAKFSVRICKNGHPITGDNQLMRPDRKAGCRRCFNDRMRHYMKRYRGKEQEQTCHS